MNKLLHISGNVYPTLEGKRHHTKNIWKELASGFDEYHVLARSESNKYSCSNEGNIFLHLVPKITKKSKIFFFTSFWMFWLIEKHKVTHLLVQCPIIGGATASLASSFYKIPLMVEIHGEEYFRFLNKNHFITKIIRFTFHRAKVIRSLSSIMTKKLEMYGISDNVITIPNRVNLSIFNKRKTDYSISSQVRLISVGRFVWEKDYLNLIKFLNRSNLNFHLTLIGGGPLHDNYNEYIIKNQLKEKVTLINWIQQENLIELISNSDIYIQSSVSEGMPRTIIEAMALQLPIISTNVGSILGVLRNEENALVINSENESELLSALEKLINDSELRIRISKQAYDDVINHYEWNSVFNLYRKTIINMVY